ncbi:MAG: hypothetical protein ACI9CE_002178 [Flavobacterium sp.]|jgi:hypothetical protein
MRVLTGQEVMTISGGVLNSHTAPLSIVMLINSMGSLGGVGPSIALAAGSISSSGLGVSGGSGGSSLAEDDS